MTPGPTFEIDAQPDPADLQFLDDQINRFNIAATGIEAGPDVLLSVIVRDEAGAVAAGIWGWTWGGCCEVSTLWVREDLRGRGYGRRLLQTVEQEAIRRSCGQIVLGTHSFQAPVFYQRQGYEVVGQVEGYPAGHTKYYLRKRLV